MKSSTKAEKVLKCETNFAATLLSTVLTMRVGWKVNSLDLWFIYCYRTCRNCRENIICPAGFLLKWKISVSKTNPLFGSFTESWHKTKSKFHSWRPISVDSLSCHAVTPCSQFPGVFRVECLFEAMQMGIAQSSIHAWIWNLLGQLFRFETRMKRVLIFIASEKRFPAPIHWAWLHGGRKTSVRASACRCQRAASRGVTGSQPDQWRGEAGNGEAG